LWSLARMINLSYQALRLHCYGRSIEVRMLLWVAVELRGRSHPCRSLSPQRVSENNKKVLSPSYSIVYQEQHCKLLKKRSMKSKLWINIKFPLAATFLMQSSNIKSIWQALKCLLSRWLFNIVVPLAAQDGQWPAKTTVAYLSTNLDSTLLSADIDHRWWRRMVQPWLIATYTFEQLRLV